MNFTEFVDFVLLRLYELDAEVSHWAGVDVEKLAAELREPVPPRWPADAVEYLRTRGLAGGGETDQIVGASITGAGRMYVEGRQHETSMIEDYRAQPGNFVIVTGSGNTIAVDTQGDVSQGATEANEAAVEPRVGFEAAVSAEAPGSLEVLSGFGMTNELVLRHQISSFARPLEHDQQGSVLRIVLGATGRRQVAELETRTKERLRDALHDSSLEAWFCDESHGRESPRWTKGSPNNGYTTTLLRPPTASVGEGSRLFGKCTFQLPIGMWGAHTIVILDVVEQAASSLRPGETEPRLHYTLGSLYSLLHILARSAIDEIGRQVFPLIFDEEPALVGPNFEISFGDRTLTDLIVLPLHFDRPPTANDTPWVYINTPEGTPLDDPLPLDNVIRNGLASMLRQSEFDGFEDDIAGLPFQPR